MAKIFISYRRDDSAYAAGRLYDRLSTRFGEDNIFMDVEILDPGVDFVETIEKSVSSCDVLVALIGRQWINIQDHKGGKRLDNTEDFVRLEIAAALEQDVRVIPILVQGARMPSSRELPQSLKRLARLNALEIRHERFNADADRLARAIEAYLEEETQRRERGATEKFVRDQDKKEPQFVSTGKLFKWKNQMETVPRWLRYLTIGIGLIVVITLPLWNSYGRFISFRDTETSKSTITASMAQTESSLQAQTTSLSNTSTHTPNVISNDNLMTPETTKEPFNLGSTQTRQTDNARMVYVPAGEFLMGTKDDQVEEIIQLCKEYDNDCDLSWVADERPAHWVRLDGFWLDQTEVSVAQFRIFITETDYVTDADRNGFSWGIWTGSEWEKVEAANWLHPQGLDSWADDDYPVVNISWDDASEYCEWTGSRLPTEAEWEYAARGPKSNIFPWGSTYDGAYANTCDVNCSMDWKVSRFDDGHERVAAIDSFPNGASWCGALNMAGNVWEWVADWYYSDYYRKSPYENPTGPEIGNERVLRGGTWYLTSYFARAAYRLKEDPEGSYFDIGFRCAHDAAR